MKRASYPEQDYAFGQLMLTLRTAIGITQAVLATTLGVSRQTVAGWEAGDKYPKANHLQAFISLAIEHRAFSDGREADEIRALWKASRQKVLLDEVWLATLLTSQPPNETTRDPFIPSPQINASRLYWEDALTADAFFGRDWELKLLHQWVIEDRCRIISVLGMGGIGKSALTVHLMHQAAPHFEVVIWRSLRDVPTCDILLDSLLQVVAPHTLVELHADMERRQSIVLDYMRTMRVLLVLDNLESVLEEGLGAGQLRPEYEGIGRFLIKCAGTAHQSCVLLTSREKPRDLTRYESNQGAVRSLRLSALDVAACEQLLASRDVVGSPTERSRLIDAYAGNPLALKIVAQTIVDLFVGELAPFLELGQVIFGGIRDLLAVQFDRLSAVEQSVMLWLAILREPSSLDELFAVMTKHVTRVQLLEAIDSLHRRSLVERGYRQGSFTLQSVVLEYTTAHLNAEASAEIMSGQLDRLIEHGLALASAREYVRQTQERLLVLPILTELYSSVLQQTGIESALLSLLDHLRRLPYAAQGYAPANLLILLRLQRGHLRGLNMSRLALRGLSLQGVEMQDSSLAESFLIDTVFTETFDAMIAVAISDDGEYWAAVSRRGEVRLWLGHGLTLHRAWRAHMDMIWTLSFSAVGHTLATGSWDCLVKVWDVASGDLLWSGTHTGEVVNMAFSPAGHILASNGGTETILWDAHTGTMLDKIQHRMTPTGITWSRDGRLLATTDIVGTIWLWEPQPTGATLLIRTIVGGPPSITGLVFSPDDTILASACTDHTVKLWEVATGHLLNVLEGHTDRVRRIAWSPDGRTIASASRDQTIWLWDVETKTCRAVLHGHTAEVWSLAYDAVSQYLLSSSVDGTLRVWDTFAARCIRVIQSFTTTIFDVDWSPDSLQLVSGGTNAQLTIWDVFGNSSPQVLSEYSTIVCSVGWSPDGQHIATSEWNHAIRLWDAVTRTQLEALQPPDDNGNMFYNLAWSPDGKLAWGTYQDALMMFDIPTRTYRSTRENFPARLRHVAWSPDGKHIAGCGYNGVIYVWEREAFQLVHQIAGHHNMIMCLAWNADGIRLAIGGVSTDGGKLFVWDVQQGESVYTLAGVDHAISAVTWDASEEMLITGSGDGHLRWWDLRQDELVYVCEAHEGLIQALRRSPDVTRLASCGNDGAIMLWDMSNRTHLQTLRRDRPYERLNITGIKGVSDTQKIILRAMGAHEHVRRRRVRGTLKT